jgi:hypothetical protein
MTSKHRGDNYWISAERIGRNQPAPIEWYRKILKVKRKGGFIVSYEELTEHPDAVQQRIEKATGLEFEDRFSNFQQQTLDERWSYLNIIRPISRRKLKDVDIPYLGKQIKICPEILRIRKQLGYDEDINLS